MAEQKGQKAQMDPAPPKVQRVRQMSAVLLPLYRKWVEAGRPTRDGK